MVPAGEPMSKLVKEVMDTNVAGTAQTTETFAPLLAKAQLPRIVFVTSSIGSLQTVSSIAPNLDWPAYSASKAAQNMFMLYYRWKFPDWKVNAYCPGLRVSGGC
jgi:NAD(P)-dependent dehydrogenase (short-subunit alcohol dehydrogenase family)